ncbi:SIS domain-containing protein [Frischella sp. Ac48]|uniref:SIS domain-containing protein n=1 Tax=Frischella japonica TaxID=2741544 RepID=A0ABR7QZW1_9GAMM|nr:MULTISPECIES: SIS domain-containing protein [Frischella]MBC9131757.1 SIS domain-containing protein [Frischella japonica]MBX4134208.1 SIS domain-containing protein [Frischella sp. Ac48]
MTKNLKGNDIIIYAKILIPSLGKKERLVANFIVNNYENLKAISIIELSKQLKVSTACITKVAKKLRCSGFYDLKKAISLSEQEQQKSESITRYEDVLEQTFLNSILALQESLSLIDMKQFKQIVSLLVNIKDNNKIVMAGCGGSGAICEDFCHKLLKIGIFSIVYHDSHLQQMGASLLEKGDIVIGISHSGKTADIVNMLEIAQNNGATTICMTNYVNSPITFVSDHPLICSVKNHPITGENATTRIVLLNILDAIFTILAMQKNSSTQNNLLKTQNAVKNKRL